jgi:hypothetical protein
VTARERNALPSGRFGLPGKRAYPLKKASQARDALSRASEFATPEEQAEIKRNVHRLYPRIKIAK